MPPDYHAGCLIAQRPLLSGTQVWPLAALVLARHTGVSLFFVLGGFPLALPFLVAICGDAAQRPACC